MSSTKKFYIPSVIISCFGLVFIIITAMPTYFWILKHRTSSIRPNERNETLSDYDEINTLDCRDINVPPATTEWRPTTRHEVEPIHEYSDIDDYIEPNIGTAITQETRQVSGQEQGFLLLSGDVRLVNNDVDSFENERTQYPPHVQESEVTIGIADIPYSVNST